MKNDGRPVASAKWLLAALAAAACGGGDGPSAPLALAPPGVVPTSPPSPRPSGPFPDTDPAWLRALAADYPYGHEVGNVRVLSDISPAFSVQHGEHLRLVWRHFESLYARNRGDWIAVYYTRDRRVFEKVLEHCPKTTVAADARILTACHLDYPRWFVMPYEIPDLGTLQHEIGHDFLDGTWWGSWQYPWFREGTGMYFEGGSFDATGRLQVREPHRYCTTNFRRHDQRRELIPLPRLVRQPWPEFLSDPLRTYSQSCMLFHYLQDRHPRVLPALIGRINTAVIVSNDQLVASMLELSGLSLEQIEAEYVAYGRQQ